MRIALFSGNYNYLRDGANQALNRLVAYAEARGHVVRVYSPTTDTPAFAPAGTLVSVPSVRLPVRGEFRLGLGLPRRQRRDLAAFAPDLIHLSAPDWLNCRALTFARRHGIPTVASVHTRFETYAEYYGCGWLRPLLDAHLDRFYRRVDHVLAPTPALRAEMAARRRDDSVGLWGRGVDTARFDPARRDEDWRLAMGFAPDEIVLLFFGRLVLEKGIDIFLSVVRALRDRGAKVRVLAVGAGPAAHLFDDLPDAVLTGHLDDGALGRAVASADIMLNPSMTEAFGNVVLEAMASGLPVVSPDTPSAAQLVDNGRTGILCKGRAVEDYVEAVAKLIADPALRRAMGAAGREAAFGRDWDAASASVEQAYVALLQRRTATDKRLAGARARRPRIVRS